MGWTATITGGVFIVCVCPALSQVTCPGDAAKVISTGTRAYDNFGNSVAIDGSTIVIGSHRADRNHMDTGAAYVFNGADFVWSETQRLIASDRERNEFFGHSVAVDGNTILVSANGDDDNGIRSGSVYVFERVDGVWVQVAKLLPADGEARDFFGQAVAIDGDTAVIAANGDDDRAENAGAVYIYERSDDGTWTQRAKITALDGDAADWFGHAVYLSGDTMLVSSPLDDDRGADTGAVYVFNRIADTWVQMAKIYAPDAQAGDLFGFSVAFDGDTICVGAAGDDGMGTDAGSVYVFQRYEGSWLFVDKIQAIDGQAGDAFGTSLALSADTLFVGAPGADPLGDSSGAVYVYRRQGNNWQRATMLLAPDGRAGDLIGTAIAIDGELVVVSAPGYSDTISNRGAAYVYPSIQLNDCCMDLDRNNSLDAADLFLFLDLFSQGDSRADFSRNRFVDSDDFFIYLDLFAAGCS